MQSNHKQLKVGLGQYNYSSEKAHVTIPNRTAEWLVAGFFGVLPAVHCWGIDGHFITCRIAQGRLNEKATDSMNELLPNSDLTSLCSWADNVRFRFHWSAPLHYIESIDTPDDLCYYRFERDCKDEDGTEGRCVSGTITIYTNQLLSSSSESQ